MEQVAARTGYAQHRAAARDPAGALESGVSRHLAAPLSYQSLIPMELCVVQELIQQHEVDKLR